MTLDQVMAQAEREIDTLIDTARARFEHSIIEHFDAVIDLDLLLECNERYLSEWRAHTLADLRRNLAKAAT